MLPELKLTATTTVKKWCENDILAVAPYYKQLNAALGVYDNAKKSEIVQVIKAAKDACDERESVINSASTVEALKSAWAAICLGANKPENAGALG